MSATLAAVRMIEVADESPDPSYLEQDGFEERRAEYEAGDFGFIGIQAQAEIHVSHGAGHIIQTITSPGLWGIESDSGAQYLAEVYEEERAILFEMLTELGISTDAAEAAEG
jgi:hypothetical protein